MLEIKSEASERRLFARKGEAVSTAAFAAGIAPGETRQAFGHDASSHDGSSRHGSSRHGSTMAGLSSLIQRRDGAALAVTTEPKSAPSQPVERKLHEVHGRLMPIESIEAPEAPETNDAPAAPQRAPVVLPMVSVSTPGRKTSRKTVRKTSRKTVEETKAQLPKPKTPARHQFTVRLGDYDFRLFSEMAVRSGRTYQDIIESAVRSYVIGDILDMDKESTETAPEAPKPAGLISRFWS